MPLGIYQSVLKINAHTNLRVNVYTKKGVLQCVCAQSLSHVRLCNPMDYSPPGSSVHGILQARILEWLPCPSPGGLPNPGIEPRSPALQADSLPSEPQGKG